MVNVSSGGRTLPGIRIQVGAGSSAQDTDRLARSVEELAKNLEHVRRSAESGATAVTQLLERTEREAARTQAKVKNQARATAPPGLEDAYRERVHERRVQRMQSTVNPTPLEQEYVQLRARQRTERMERDVARPQTKVKHQARVTAPPELEDAYRERMQEHRVQRMQSTVTPTPLEQEYGQLRERQRTERMERALHEDTPEGRMQEGRRQTAHAAIERRESSFAGRAANALGWAPGVPSEVYLGQMALTAAMPAIGGAALLGITGGLLAGGATMAASTMETTQRQTGEELTARAGIAPNESGGQATALLQQREYDLGLKGGQGVEIAAGLAEGGLSRQQSTGEPMAQAAALVNVFGMSIKDATEFVSRGMMDLGHTSEDVTTQLRDLAITSAATGTPLGSLSEILRNVPNLQADVSIADQGPVAAMARRVYGSNQTATTMLNLAEAHGTGAFALGGLLGMSPEQLAATRGRGAEGRAEIFDRLNARARQFQQQSGPEAGYAAFNSFLSQSGAGHLSWEEWQRVQAQAPNAARADLASSEQTQARSLIADRRGTLEDRKTAEALGIGAHGTDTQALAQLVQGNPAAAAQAAVPPSLYTDLRHQAQMIATGAGDVIQRAEVPGVPGVPGTSPDATTGVAGYWRGIGEQIIHGDPSTLPQTVKELGQGADPGLYSRIAQGLLNGLARDDTSAGRGNLSPAATEVAYLRGGWQQTPGQDAQPAATPQLATYNTPDQGAGVRDVNVKGIAEIAVRLLDSLGHTVGIEHISVPLSNSRQQGDAYVPRRMGGLQDG